MPETNELILEVLRRMAGQPHPTGDRAKLNSSTNRDAFQFAIRKYE
jgi:hypothetical protein